MSIAEGTGELWNGRCETVFLDRGLLSIVHCGFINSLCCAVSVRHVASCKLYLMMEVDFWTTCSASQRS